MFCLHVFHSALNHVYRIFDCLTFVLAYTRAFLSSCFGSAVAFFSAERQVGIADVCGEPQRVEEPLLPLASERLCARPLRLAPVHRQDPTASPIVDVSELAAKQNSCLCRPRL